MFIAPKILLPPGIGDVYWSLVKMESFLKKKELGKPDIYVACRPDKYNSGTRAFLFIEQFSFVNSTGIVLDNDLADDQEFWTHAYTQSHTGIFENVIGCDYFIVYNGPINAGVSLDAVDMEYGCNWGLEIPDSIGAISIMQEVVYKYGNYIVYHFGTQGTYKYWTQEFSVNEIIESIKCVSGRTQTTPILVGSIWDRDDTELLRIIKEAGCVDMLGKTSFEGLCGLLRGSNMVVGYPSGLEMLATILGKKTLTLWSGYYPEATSRNIIAPDKFNTLYFAKKTAGLTVQKFVNRIEEING